MLWALQRLHSVIILCLIKKNKIHIGENEKQYNTGKTLSNLLILVVNCYENLVGIFMEPFDIFPPPRYTLVG